ncbi:MAG: galactose oxidase-like domain-containing protein, partial [Thermosynechococcaceae cyanobacterium]
MNKFCLFSALAIAGLWSTVSLGAPLHSPHQHIQRRGPAPKVVIGATENLGGCVLGAPASAWTSDGQYHVIARSCTNNAILYKKWSGSSWSNWQTLAGCTKSQPSLISRGNKLWLYVLGCNSANAIEGTSSINAGQTWSSWQSIGGKTTSNPAIEWRDNAEQNLDVFVRSVDNALWRRTWNASTGWSVWQSLGGCLKDGPGVASTRNGRLDVVYIGCDNGIYQQYTLDGTTWSSRVKLGGPVSLFAPSAVWTNNQLEVYIQATNSTIWQRNWDGKQWSPWRTLSGCTKSGASVTSGLSVGRVDLAAAACDNTALHFTGQISPIVPSPVATLGQWSTAVDWPVVAIHTTLLANGKVLSWDAVNDDHTSWWVNRVPDYDTRVDLWDPATNQHTWVNEVGNGDMFCAGFASLPDGRLLVAGGNFTAGIPIRNTNIFNLATGLWSIGNLLNQARWYGTLTPLNSGEMMMTGGGPGTPEVFGLNGIWRLVNNAYRGDYAGTYPWTQQAPNGQVFYAGPGQTLSYLDPAGSGSTTTLGNRDSLYRDYGSYATYGIGKVLVTGGSSSAASAYTIDYASGTPQVRSTSSMAYGRRQHNLTLLANGEVMATGGISNGASLVALNAAVYAGELWSPDTGQWRTVANMAKIRQYHSTALLLPDGRVLSGGGGVCGDCTTVGYKERNVEFYSPPYLFRADGSLAARPVIQSAPSSVQYGTTFNIQLANWASLAKVHLIRPGSVTHSVNQEQRLVPLSFTQSGNSVTAMAPTNSNLAPPGYYMLFAVDNNGVPSVAKFVRMGSVTPTFQTRSKTVLQQQRKLDIGKADGTAFDSGSALMATTTQSKKTLNFMASPIHQGKVRLSWFAYNEKKFKSFKVYRGKDSLLEQAVSVTSKPIPAEKRYEKVYSISDSMGQSSAAHYWLQVTYANGKTQRVGPLQPSMGSQRKLQQTEA